MNGTKLKILPVLLVLILVSLACNIPGSTAPTRPPTSVPLSSEEVQQFEEEVAATLENAEQSGPVTITITEQQLNTYLQREMEADSEQMIQKPQVHLTNGKIEVYGQMTQASLTADAKIVLIPLVAAGGKPRLDVESMSLGPFPVPQSVVDQVEQRVDTLLEDYLATMEGNFSVSDITVTEGQMTITGERL
jgi:uncharacterized protein YpmS